MDNRVLIVEDEPKLREVLCDYFTSKGDCPIPAADGLQALEMLDLSRLEAGRVKLARDEFSLLTLCRGVFDKLDLALQAKELRITYNCEARNTRQGVAFSFRI